MRPFLILAGIVISCNCFAQSDTAIIRMAFDYLNSDSFRISCNDSIKAAHANNSVKESKRKRKSQPANITGVYFLDDKHFFAPAIYYLKGDTAPVRRWQHDTIPFGMKYVPPQSREKRLLAMPRFSGHNVLSIEFFNSPFADELYSKVKFGESYIFEFIILDRTTIKYKGYRELINN